jgi:hypothetical protein
MGIFDEQAGSSSPEATTAGVRAVAAVVLLVGLPQLWGQVFFGLNGLPLAGPGLLQVLTLFGALVPGLLAYASWRHRSRAPLWVRALAGGTMIAAAIVGAVAVLGLVVDGLVPG